jgi:hypothetical protein
MYFSVMADGPVLGMQSVERGALTEATALVELWDALDVRPDPAAPDAHGPEPRRLREKKSLAQRRRIQRWQRWAQQAS